MQTVICCTCRALVDTPRRDVLLALRDHVLDQPDTHPAVEVVCRTLDSEFWELILANGLR